ncbi:MAG: DUF86 domain-containing protein [Phycisphaerae bacterium]
MLRDEATLLDINRSARLVREFAEGLEFERFQQDVKTQSAVIHQLLIVGEAAKRLSAQFRSKYVDIPWSKVAGMRDKLIHAYDEVDLEEVWRTVEHDIPELIEQIGPLLSGVGDT